MDLRSWRINSRILVSIGSALLAVGILIFLFSDNMPIAYHDWAHAVGGLFMGVSMGVLVRAIWVKKHPERYRNCGT